MVDSAKFTLKSNLTLLQKNMMMSIGKRCTLITHITCKPKEDLFKKTFQARRPIMKNIIDTCSQLMLIRRFRSSTITKSITTKIKFQLLRKILRSQPVKMLLLFGEDKILPKNLLKAKMLMILMTTPLVLTMILPTSMVERTFISSTSELMSQ